MAQNGFLVDLKRCSGCKACQVACKAENNTRPQPGDPRGASVNYRRVVFSRAGSDPATMTRLFVSTACYHCGTPACAPVCPVGAISKRGSDGVVLIDYSLCIGCRRCFFACPYGAPQYNGAMRKTQKCTFCEHLLAQNLTPACVATCLTKALTYRTDIVNNSTAPIIADGPTMNPGETLVAGEVNATWLRDSTTYGTVLNTSVPKHAATKPNVGFRLP